MFRMAGFGGDASEVGFVREAGVFVSRRPHKGGTGRIGSVRRWYF